MESKRSYFYSVGKRKTAIARVKLFQEGTGDAKVNNLALKDYFAGTQIENATAALLITSNLKNIDIEVFVKGGGKSAQSDAIRHGITRALLLINPELRGELKHAGFLRRDSRKKPGLHGARRAPQFSKR
jgi:small subunit ribosomal protein S9